MASKDGIVTNHVRKNVITVTRRPGNVLEPVTRDIMETSANITIEVFLLLQSFIFLFMILVTFTEFDSMYVISLLIE